MITTIYPLPNGRKLDLDSPAGANEYLTNRSVRYPFSRLIAHTKEKIVTTEMNRQLKLETGFVLHLYGGIFNHASVQNVQQVHGDEISSWVDFLLLILKIRVKAIEDGFVCEDIDARLLNAIQPSIRHDNCLKMMEEMELFKALADFIAAHKAPNMPNDDIAESVCFIVLNILANRKEKVGDEWGPTVAEKAYRKLEGCGLLTQYIRCSTCPGTWNIEHGKLMKYRVYEELQNCAILIRRKFLGGPCGKVINDILAGKDGHRTYKDNRITQYLLNIKEIAGNIESQKTEEKVKEFKMCRNCDKRGTDFKTCAQCKITYYCSKACQKADWKKHKKTCVVRTKQMENAKKSGNALIYDFLDKHAALVVQAFEEKKEETGLDMDELLLELNFLSDDCSGRLAPSLRNPPEFKIGITRRYYEGNRPEEPEWLKKDRGFPNYEFNIRGVLANLTGMHAKMTTDFMMIMVMYPTNPSVLRMPYSEVMKKAYPRMLQMMAASTLTGDFHSSNFDCDSKEACE